MPIEWGNVISAVVPSLIETGVGILGSNIASDKAEADREYAESQANADRALELKLAALKARYGSGGGSGGGSGIDPNKLTKAQHVAAVQGQGDTEQNAIANLISAMQNAYGMSARG